MERVPYMERVLSARGVFMARRYTNPRLTYLTLVYSHWPRIIAQMVPYLLHYSIML